MKIIIQTPGFKADQKLLDFVTQKLEKLNQLNDDLVEGHVCLKLDNSNTQENKVCEIKLPIRGNDLFAMKQDRTFEDATNKVVEALKNQLSGLKRDH